MERAWDVLMVAGLPDGPLRPLPVAMPIDDVKRAIHELLPNAHVLSTHQRELLLAWLRAWQHHWPRRFDQVLGDDGEALIQVLRSAPVDESRYLKLRRIAIANLANLL